MEFAQPQEKTWEPRPKVHIVAGEGMVAKVGDYFLGSVSEEGDRVAHTQKEAGIVKEKMAGVCQWLLWSVLFWVRER